MLFYWIIFLLLAWLAFCCKDRKKAFIVSFAILLLMGATRGSTVGNDMRGGYSDEFRYIHADPSTWGKSMYQFEVGFSWLMGNFKDYVSDDRMLFFHCLFLVTFLMRCYPVKWYSRDGAVTMFFMYGLAYYFSMYNTMRQELAFSVICMFLPFVLERKRYLLFAVLTLISAFLFHKSQAMLLLLIPMAAFIDSKVFTARNLVIALALSSVLGLTLTGKVMSLLESYAYLFEGGDTHYAAYMTYTDNIGEFSVLTPVLHTLFCIYVVYLHRRKLSVFLLCYVSGVIILNLLTPISWIFQRIAYTFMYFSIFVYAYLWSGIPRPVERKVFRWAVLVFTVILFARRLLADGGEDVVPYVSCFFE